MIDKINLLNYCVENNYLNISNFVDEEMLKILKNEINNLNINIDYITIPFGYKFENFVKLFFPNCKFIYIQ